MGKKADKIFVVDFGNCRKFVDEENNHYFIGKEPQPLKNNLRFRSIHSHIGKSIFLTKLRNIKERWLRITRLPNDILFERSSSMGWCLRWQLARNKRAKHQGTKGFNLLKDLMLRIARYISLYLKTNFKSTSIMSRLFNSSRNQITCG